jgi:uncharacterized protein (TIGR02001 family)
MANIKSFLGAAGAAALASLAMSTAAFADEERTFGYSITLSGTSDYIFRGLSFSEGKPAFQPFVEFTYGIAYLDFWGSNISGDYNPFELDIYAGIRPVTGPVNWDIGVLYYTYPDSKIAGDLDYVEFKVGATTSPLTNLTLGITGYITPDQANYGQTETVEGSISYTLPQFAMFTPTASGLIGYSNGDDGFSACACGKEDYTYWNAGVKLAVDKYFMDFRYWGTDINKPDATEQYAGDRFVFTAGVNLP